MKKSKLILGLVASSLFLNSCINRYKFDDNENTDPKPKESDISKLLTGGAKDKDGKTWVLLSAPYSAGIGPYIEKEISGAYWGWPDGLIGDPFDQGVLQNEFTFVSKNTMYIPKNQMITAHWAYANKYFGTNLSEYNFIALNDPSHKQAPFVLKDEKIGITGYTLEITNGSYIGYFDGVHKYEIAKINADTMILRHKFSDSADDDPSTYVNSWHFTFVAKK